MGDTRRVTYHSGRSLENDELTIITIWEPGANKELIKRDNCYSKKHEVLIQQGDTYEFMG
ncbi:hypothetical protein [Bacillus testis]|uniref:hypothetical protein n=1 Tax=Bacillus testis TaxID=1622072 RepID=UPI00067F05CB|nr:hypothetical protein [Bacillus testis]